MHSAHDPSRRHVPRKRFGQHFLHDPGVIARLLQAIRPQAEDHLIEIGPGLGALTQPLLAQAGRLDVVEIDRDVIPLLRERCSESGRLNIHCADALTFDFGTLATSPLRVVGNLPYNISTPLLFHLLKHIATIRDMHFMVQKEVAQRLAAPPGSPHYGRLSVMVQWQCQVEGLFTVGAGAFTPPPKVDSAVVRLIPHAVTPVQTDQAPLFRELVNRVFTQRRKTLRNGLKGLLSAEDIARLGISPDLRPEVLGIAEFAALAEAAGYKRRK